MVHRIQNRNPGYSDFAANGLTQSFVFNGNNTNPVSHGANALKLENEIVTNELQNQTSNQSVNDMNNQYHEELLKNQDTNEVEDKKSEKDEISYSKETSESFEETEVHSNDLREFGVDTNEPDLFSSSDDNSETNDLSSTLDEDNDDDDLEIPAFLRRQKN